MLEHEAMLTTAPTDFCRPIANMALSSSANSSVFTESGGAIGGATLDHQSPQFRQPLPPGIRPGMRFAAQQHPQYRAAQVTLHAK